MSERLIGSNNNKLIRMLSVEKQQGKKSVALQNSTAFMSVIIKGLNIMSKRKYKYHLTLCLKVSGT